MIQIQGLPILQVFIICFLAYMGHNYWGTVCKNSPLLMITSVDNNSPTENGSHLVCIYHFVLYTYTHIPPCIESIIYHSQCSVSPGSVIFLVTEIVLHLLPASAKRSCNQWCL
jgi:hypothetical protein